jgi:hypothetical protein
MPNTAITEMVKRRKMSSCKKCRAGAMRVHILSNGFCQECNEEMAWKNGDREARKQANRARRMAMYEKGKKIIEKKWKDKYGDDDPETVLGYK